MFGGRRRRKAEAAKEAERRALFAQLAQRPAHICPFLGLAYERTAYVDGPSMEHRCFAFGEPAPLSSEQQTRVCQEKGYGQCPRYLRGLLVTPTEELQALRNPQAAAAAAAARAAPRPPPPPPPRRPVARPAPPPRQKPPRRPRSHRRGILTVLSLVMVLVVLAVGIGAAYLLLWTPGSAFNPTPTPQPSATAVPADTPTPTASPTVRPTATPTADASDLVSPTPEPTPSVGDTFAFYEVSVGPGSNLLFEIDDDGNVGDERRATFDDFSFARVEPIEGTDGDVYWRTEDGGLAGLAYHVPESGEFRIRAVFIDDGGARRSVYLEQEDLTTFPEATPAP